MPTLWMIVKLVLVAALIVIAALFAPTLFAQNADGLSSDWDVLLEHSAEDFTVTVRTPEYIQGNVAVRMYVEFDGTEAPGQNIPAVAFGNDGSEFAN